MQNCANSQNIFKCKHLTLLILLVSLQNSATNCEAVKLHKQ